MKKLFYLFLICVGLGIGLFLYAFFIEPNQVEIKTYSIKDKELSGLKIAFLTDLHIAPSHTKRLRNIINLTNNQKPDIILLGGDYANGHSEKTTMPLSLMAQELSRLKAPLGVYAVLGNHDWMIDGKKLITEFEKVGIFVLLNSYKTIKLPQKNLYIVGVEEDVYRHPDIQKSLEHTSLPRILVTHNPDLFQTLTQKVSLTLAGHNHGGQVVIPFIGPLIVSGKTGIKYARGLFYENNNSLIVGAGIGTSFLPIRLNCPPEIVVITFQ